MMKSSRLLALSGMVFLLSAVGQDAFGREAAFVQPDAAATNTGSATVQGVAADPAETNTGESLLGIARRVTLFFTNNTGQEVAVKNINLGADGNVTAKIVSDDCSDLKTIPVRDRCGVSIDVTPNASGPWTVEVLMVHDGAGRIARAQILGETLGERKNQDREPGLGLTPASTQVIDFGSVPAGSSTKIARTILMANTSPQPVTLESIDVIAAGDGLARHADGCAKDMELAPGQTCPITLVWQPTSGGSVSTDLIIRHNGPNGFVVVPVRGTANGGKEKSDTREEAPAGRNAMTGRDPSMDALTGLPLANIPAVSSTSLGNQKAEKVSPPKLDVGNDIGLIGIAGDRGIFRDASGGTTVLGAGATIHLDGVAYRIAKITDKIAILESGKNVRTLTLGSPGLPQNRGNGKSSKDKSGKGND
jgi:hypothetical protein